jgi:8-oxo-dGTP pyrophosphatase MutT (NUDIX family)
MDEALSFLAAHTPATVEVVAWPRSTFRLSSYLCDTLPPAWLITSVRAVVISGRCVLALHNPDEFHILPGGRRERDEHLEQTALREVLEETGWRITVLRLLGVRHFYHLTPRPEGDRYPYPDFFQVVYLAAPAGYASDGRLPDDYESHCRWMTIDEALAQNLPADQVVFLRAAGQASAHV